LIRRVLSAAIAVLTGMAAVTALSRAIGPAPPWLAYLCGTAVILTTLAQLEVRITGGSGRDVTDDPSVRGGRHRRNDRRVRHGDDDDGDYGAD
jgi:hypothetical protein